MLGAGGRAHPENLADVIALEKMLTDHRLVSIVGTAGIGKTSVAVAVANTVAHKFGDGVCLIELAAVSDGDLVIEIVASALKLTLALKAKIKMMRACRR